MVYTGSFGEYILHQMSIIWTSKRPDDTHAVPPLTVTATRQSTNVSIFDTMAAAIPWYSHRPYGIALVVALDKNRTCFLRAYDNDTISRAILMQCNTIRTRVGVISQVLLLTYVLLLCLTSIFEPVAFQQIDKSFHLVKLCAGCVS